MRRNRVPSIDPVSGIYQKFRGSAVRKSLVDLRRRLRDAALRPVAFRSGAGAFEIVYRGPPARHRRHRDEFINAPGRFLEIDGSTPASEVRRYRGDLRLETQTGLIWRAGRPIADSDDGFGTPKMPGMLRMWRATPRAVERCISFLHMNAANYYHAMTFVLPRLALLEQAGIDAALPIIVPAALARQPFFRGVVATGYFGARALVAVEDNEAVAATEVIVVRPEAAVRHAFDAVLDRLGVPEHPAGDRRLFVRRGKGAANKRFIRNEADLLELLTRLGFDPIDPQELSFRDQIATFAQAAMVVSQHGAGLTNIIYRRCSPLHVIELFIPAVLQAGYQNIAGEFGFRYSPFLNLNSDGSWSGPSDADLPALEAFLARDLGA